MERSSVCLSMIVKNEAHVVARALASVRPWISSWVVVDTGSTDDTPGVVEKAMAGVPGTLLRRPWVDFAHNRTEALELARARADYALVIDADDELVLPPGFLPPRLTHDAYTLRIEYGATVYWRAQLFKSSAPWRWAGVVHEYPECGVPTTQARLEGPFIRIVGEGARSRDPERYVKDARLLEAALEKAPNDARSVFYLAQSWRDAQRPELALPVYERRAAMGGWDEEVFYALMQRAAMMERVGKPRGEVWAAYLEAWRARPTRAEPLCDLARYCRLGEEFSLAYLFGERAAKIPRPADALFVDDGVYRWRALDEYALGAFYTQRFDECASACAALLTEGRLPEGERERVKRNLAFVADARVTAR